MGAHLKGTSMAKVELIIRKNRSTFVNGDVVLKDQDGNITQPPKVPFSLCRFGASNTSLSATDPNNAIKFDDSKNTVTA